MALAIKYAFITIVFIALFANTVSGNSIYRTVAADCGNWVHFRGVNPGEWFNNNIFVDNETWYPTVWINFEWQPNIFSRDVNNNLFFHNFCEAATFTTDAAKNVRYELVDLATT